MLGNLVQKVESANIVGPPDERPSLRVTLVSDSSQPPLPVSECLELALAKTRSESLWH